MAEIAIAKTVEYVTGRELGKALCDALGIDADMVQSLTIYVEATSAALITVEYYASKENLQAMHEVLSAAKFRLVREV